MLSTLDKALALRAAPLFANLDIHALLPLAGMCTEVTLDTGDLLFEAGEWGDSMYVVARGAVEVEAEGRALATLEVGDVVGEMAALDWEPRSATVRARGPALLICVDRHDLLDLLAEHPALADELARVLARRLRDTSSPG